MDPTAFSTLRNTIARMLTAMCVAVVFLLGSSGVCAETGASSFAGVNWADRRDNFVDGWIVPSGIEPSRSSSDVAAQARAILTELKQKLSINTVRLGINPATVQDSTWWSKYRAIIDEATKLELKVILACWESKGSKDGSIDDPQAFNRMWDQVLNDYGGDTQVYFEIFNEPHGYSDQEWRDLAAAWIAQHAGKIRGKDRGRILVSGSGYSERLTHVAADPRFDGCLLSFHLYAWFGAGIDSVAGWRKEIEERIGRTHAARTVVTEWGAPMKNLPNDYYTKDSPDGDKNRAYLVAMADAIRDWNMGSVYWPGLRDEDAFSLTERENGFATLRVTNESGKALLLRSFTRPPTREGK